MTIYDIKPIFQNFLRPIATFLHKLKITPNQITIFTCIYSVIFSYFLYMHPGSLILLGSVPVFLFSRMALNAIDGMVANEFNLKTNLGSMLNELTDVISDSLFYFAFLSQAVISKDLLLLVIILSIISEFVGVSAVQIGSPRGYQGPMGKSDRAFVFGVIALLLIFTSLSAAIYQYIFIGISSLLILTIFNRVRKALLFTGPSQEI